MASPALVRAALQLLRPHYTEPRAIRAERFLCRLALSFMVMCIAVLVAMALR